MEFKHPKYYKELRKRNKSDQVISRKDSTEARRRAPGPGLKLQASSDKPQAEGSRPGRPSAKHQAPSVKLRSSFVDSTKLQADIKNPE